MASMKCRSEGELYSVFYKLTYNVIFEELYEVLARDRAFNDVICNDAVECENGKYGAADASDEALTLNTWRALSSSTIFAE
jgi:hypothetical protein